MGAVGIDRYLLVNRGRVGRSVVRRSKQITGKNKNNRGAKVVSMLARRRATATQVAIAA